MNKIRVKEREQNNLLGKEFDFVCERVCVIKIKKETQNISRVVTLLSLRILFEELVQ